MKKNYGKLKRKLVVWMLLVLLLSIVACAVVMYVFVDGIFQAPFADGFIRICRTVFQMSDETAHRIYWFLFRDNKIFWMGSLFLLLMLTICYQALSRFTRYFNEVGDGVEQLLSENAGPIELSPELEFMEKQLNTIRQTLEKRAFDAKEAEQRKNDLVVYLAHDIKTPLTSVIGYLSLMEEAYDMPEEQRKKYMSITLDKACRLEQLINEFFDITRFNLQTILLDKEEINLPYMLLQMADEFYPMLTPQGKQVSVSADEDLKINADPDKIARVFNNILKNAAAYSYPDTTIEIEAKRYQENAYILFRNRGKTIPPGKLETIFEKFYRLDETRSSHTGGSGLGLAIAREIVKAHGGTISVDSADEVTEFKVVLPLR